MRALNPLLDKDFLKELDEFRHHDVYARITALSQGELPLEQIEGKVTGGSVNIDGSSAVRRTCNLSMIAQDVNINDFYWGLHNKFKLEIGLKNIINENYPDIIWFPQGLFVINSFNTSLSTSGFNISISGKDKMCLLNGEVGGQLPASVDFGVEEFVDKEKMITTKTKVPIKKIIKEMLHAYALEPYHNIIINDLVDYGLELLEYRGDDPAYLLYNIDESEYKQCIFDKNKEYLLVTKDANDNEISYSPIKVSDVSKVVYKSRVDDLLVDKNASVFAIISQDKDGNYVPKNDNRYQLSKLEYGQTAGYRYTDLVYPGDLISSIGESITSVLDKIVAMLGNFEYFYDLEGRFMFQEKPTYVQTSWNNIIDIDDDVYVENSAYATSCVYNFEGNNLISSFQNTPNLMNLRNDYSIWGTRKTVNDVEVPVHYRYAIHRKPTYYKNVAGEVFTTHDLEDVVSLPNRDLLPECLKSGFEGEWWNIFDWAERYKILTGEYPTLRVGNYVTRTCKLDLNKYFPPVGYSWRADRPLFLFDVDADGNLMYAGHNPSSDSMKPSQSCTHTYQYFIDKARSEGWVSYIYDPMIPKGTNILYKKVDWREIIYQMALDYYKYNELGMEVEGSDPKQYIPLETLIRENNPDHYPTGYTGYEQFYLDIQGFWRQLYNLDPPPKYYQYLYDTNDTVREFTPLNDKEQVIEELYIDKKYTSLNSNSKVEDRSKVYVLKSINGAWELQKLADTISVNYNFNEAGVQELAPFYYITAEKTEENKDGFKLVTKETADQISKQELFVKKGNEYVHITDAATLTSSCYLIEDIEDEDEYVAVSSLDSRIIQLYRKSANQYYQYSPLSKLNLKGEVTEGTEPAKNYFNYYVKFYEYFTEDEKTETTYWNRQIYEAPDSLNFWMDFLDSSEEFYDDDIGFYKFGAELDRYSISAVGDRTKVINDSNVKSIYFRDVPNLIFTSTQQLAATGLRNKTGYAFMQVSNTNVDPSGAIEFAYFNISAQGKSAKEKLDELLYNHSYCIESVNISAIPIYYLEPNTRISVRDDNSKINGEYIVSRISIPLTYNGMMSITATKAPQRLY